MGEFFFSVLAKHEVTLEMSTTSCLKSLPYACFYTTVFDVSDKTNESYANYVQKGITW